MSNQEAGIGGSEGEFSHNIQPTSGSSIYEIPAISTAAFGGLSFATHDQEALQFSDIMNILSDVELPTSKISCMTESEDKGESSGTKRKYGEFLEHSQAHSDAAGGDFREKDLKISGESGQSGRSRSAEAHNMTERLRRRQFKEKLRALQELVPNCSKKDAASTLENATKYIKFLQNQVQMMSMGAGLMSQSHFPSWNQEMKIPNLFPALQVGPRFGVGMGYGTGMYGMLPSINIPMSPLALPSPCSSASSSLILRFPVLGGSAQIPPIPPLHFPCDTMSVTSVSSFPSASCAVTQVESSSHGVPCSSFELNTSKRIYK